MPFASPSPSTATTTTTTTASPLLSSFSAAEPMSSSSSSPSPESSRLIFLADPDRTHRDSSPPPAPNAIRTTKYSLLTFLPRNLFEQFRRVAYIYFLLLALLNQLPQLAVYGRATAFVPLGTVLVLTAIKDGYEDFRRHRSDKAENRRPASVLSPLTRSFVSSSWSQIRAGDIVRVSVNETIPCDIVLLSTSDPTGAAYVQTINLDGESNLKTRYALQETIHRPAESWLDHHDPEEAAVIRCELPNLNIYGFQATVELDGRKIPLGPTNVVLRGCEIKNTEWIIGVAVYTGMETKVMLNNSGAPSKRSRLETRMNREIIMLAVIMFVLCGVIIACTAIWLYQNRQNLATMPFYRKADYSSGTEKNYLYDGIWLEVFFTFLKAIMSFQNFIPISLYICMELARVTQSFMMTQDKNMYHEATDTKFQCRALNINEDLGQIKYVFSDKTGTLTENKMVFRCASVDGVDYGRAEEPIPGQVATHPAMDGQVWRPKMVVNTDPDLMRLLEHGKGTEEWLHARNFFIALAACNTIVPQVTETAEPTVKVIDYQGESPDEQALVYAAAAYGFVLIERTSGHILINVLGERQRFTILGVHEFDSDRKRMSVIVGCPDKTVKLVVKGADSAMLNVMADTLNTDKIQATKGHLHSYSSLGLRTLVIGMRDLSTAEFEEWQIEYDKASMLLTGRVEVLQAVALKIECNLHILGASGIEDKLQLGVPEAIESLRQAGIRVWVLTGDKQETAISIGFSCKLLTSEMNQIVINSHSKESCKSSLEDAISLSKKLNATSLGRGNSEGSKVSGMTPLALIIDGPTLVFILETELEEELYKLAMACDVVLCCRVAPLQKAGIVSLMKKRTNDMTLSIGDGANDVSMIQMADVGIGISGQEGRQAVMASDFAMGQFRFLVPLLLVHGHWNYQRMAYMILYNYYKNALSVLMAYWYVFFTDISLFNPITEASLMLYSAVYTALPTVVVGIYDQDLSTKTLLKYPKLYGAGPREENYNMKLFILFMLDSCWQSLVLVFATFFAYRHSSLDDSSLGDIWILGLVVLVNFQLAMDIIRWHWLMHVTIWGLTLLTFGCVVAIEASPTTSGYGAANHLLVSKVFWLMFVILLALAFLPRFLVKTFSAYFQPSDIRIARELEKFVDPNESTPLEAPENPSINAQRR